ncbi:hypothetical protein J6590_002666 [Homalodisca vitripennis]|nr:hypothetical protein J6590_002666 [Homalodisca vitripennis]
MEPKFKPDHLAVKGSQDSSSKGKDSNNLDSFNCDGEPPSNGDSRGTARCDMSIYTRLLPVVICPRAMQVIVYNTGAPRGTARCDVSIHTRLLPVVICPRAMQFIVCSNGAPRGTARCDVSIHTRLSRLLPVGYLSTRDAVYCL